MTRFRLRALRALRPNFLSVSRLVQLHEPRHSGELGDAGFVIRNVIPTDIDMTTIPGQHWHDTIPGARWFRSDLQIHTLDDFPGGRVAPVQGSRGGIDKNSAVAYARAILDSAVASGTLVLGLTPHAVRCGGDGAPSCVWETVSLWRDGTNAEGRHYRDLIYAVFPGFEVSVHDGKRGVHLAFLFDPSISRDRLFAAHGAAMGNVPSWQEGRLEVSRHGAAKVFAELDAVFKKAGDGPHFLCYTPHAFGENGVFRETDSQIRNDLPWNRISAIDVGRNKIPEELFEEKPWLKEGVGRLRLATIHTTDCYNAHPNAPAANAVGYRPTLIKLAAPTLSALRQAFLAAESRIACVFRRGGDGELVEREELPDPLAADQPWLREIQPHHTSFLRQRDEDGSDSVDRVLLSPGLTCIIGGRMSGKSTLLDGLRVATGSTLPSDESIGADVRARSELLHGGGEPALDFSGSAHEPAGWPAQFFTQRELQLAIRDQGKIREIIFGLDRIEAPGLIQRQATLEALDTDLVSQAEVVAERQAQVVDARQSFKQAQTAADALKRFEDVGADRIEAAQANAASAKARLEALVESQSALSALKDALSEGADHGLDLESLGIVPELVNRIESVESALVEGATKVASALAEASESWELLSRELSQRVEAIRRDVIEQLIARGGSQEDLKEFDTFRRNAALLEPARRKRSRLKAELGQLQNEFDERVAERRRLIEEQREALVRVQEAIQSRFSSQIRIRVVEEGDRQSLEEWIRALVQRGVTRWWNGAVEAEAAPGAGGLLEAYRSQQLQSTGMSADVADSFRRALDFREELRLEALRSPDTFSVEWKAGDDYRSLDRLSGGQQVSVLLSLLLEMDDRKPLIIDQPEDELDNAYLMDTVLPRLRQLKGKRQVIFATHNANIVVNGDADQVICLQADASRGWVESTGAIEDGAVRKSIVETLDGGEKAFDLRREKYGF